MTRHLRLAPALTGSTADASTRAQLDVLLADDHDLMRHSLRVVLEGEEGVRVVAETADLASTLRAVSAHQPQVLVLDLRLPRVSSAEPIGRLRARAPSMQVVVLTMSDSPVFAQHTLTCGARGFVLKDHADSELPRAIQTVARDEEYVSPRVTARLHALRRSLSDDRLTPRQLEVLRLVALGHTSVEIAARLDLSARTVESYRAQIHRKLGLSTRAELVHVAVARGLLGTSAQPPFASS
jgi:two-component system, NarL family, response regulator NreC